MIRKVLCCLLFCSTLGQAQICKPTLSLYFNSGKFALSDIESDKLNRLIKNLDRKTEYLIEIYASTDDVGSETLNEKLSKKRAVYIQNIFDENLPKEILSIYTFGNGETNPKFTNLDEENRRLNRRVDIMIFPIIDGKIILKSERGVEVEVDSNFFQPCGVCGSNPQIHEIFNEKEARESQISLTSINGEQLVTGGMASFTYNCSNSKNDTICKPFKLRIPTTDFDPEMTVWTSIDTLGEIRWINQGKKCRQSRSFYELDSLCTRTINSKTWCNCDKPKRCSVNIELPSEKSDFILVKSEHYNYLPTPNLLDTSLYFIEPDCIDSLKTLMHSYKKDGIEYTYEGTIEPFKSDHITTEFGYIIPEYIYTKNILLSDTTIILKLPRKHNSIPNVYVSPIDSSYAINIHDSNKRKFEYLKPLADSEIIVCSNNSSSSSSEHFTYDKIKMRYKKRKGVFKATIKRKHLED